MEKNFAEIEKKWEKFWEENQAMYQAKDASEKPKKYVLVEFPYPSGSGLHVGHAFTFTGGDVYARFKRMQGHEVLFPMGWDAFGLPTENYAIKMKRKPAEVTKENTDSFREEMKRLAFSFDWSREVNTTDPNYYKWTQWIFIQLFKKGLAYKEEMPINWCPSCKIGLANEEVVDGKCERCGAEVERRTIKQWVVRITKYADRLIEGLKGTAFIDKVKAAQINWIDRKEWIDITYKIKESSETVTVATTRPDTNFGATFIVLAPEHELVTKLITGKIKTNEDLGKIKEYVAKARNKSELERQREVVGRDKTGVFSGLVAINPLTGKEMPIWITDFVLNTVGTGAVVGVPGHDIRDFEFARQFGLEVIRVVVGKNGEKGEITDKSQVQEESGTMINSGFLDGLEIHEATTRIMDYLENKGWGKRSIRYHLRDWIFSRQHYWGEPIPMIYCSECGWVPEKEENLPIVLPEVEAYQPTDTGESPLAKITDWLKTTCPKCGGEAKRETDTMPNWAGSDWYFLRYIDPFNDMDIASIDKLKKWLPVDVYIGGDEHNTLHLLYSRFIYQFLWDIGAVPKEHPEPYYKRISHGVILGSDGARMSKSRGNVVVPGDVADRYGADVLRMYLMFMGPYDATMAWNEKTLVGVKRFLERVASMSNRTVDETEIDEASLKNQKKILGVSVSGVTRDLEAFGYNTAIAKLMEAVNGLRELKVARGIFKTFLTLLAPFAPYTAEELWSRVRQGSDPDSVHASNWPIISSQQESDEETIVVPVAINGKVRGQLEVERQLVNNEEEILRIAKENENIIKWLGGIKVVREIYVKGKMVNLVTL